MLLPRSRSLWAFAADSNLSMIVVMMSALPCVTSSTRCSPLFAFSTDFRQARNVFQICVSRSTRSVTITTLGFLTLASSDSALASITIVRLLPEPVVCQITPPWRFSSPFAFVTSAIVSRMAKNCWYRATFFTALSKSVKR